MIRSKILTLATILLLPWAAIAEEHRIEKLDESVPAGSVSSQIAPLLQETGITIYRGETRKICDIWLLKQWDVAQPTTLTRGILYPFTPGQLIGVIRYARRGSDFRDQDIESGVYTIRYGQQPVNGDHVGTSPTRDFLLLLNSDTDQSKQVLKYEQLAEESAVAAQSSHPAILCMTRAKAEGKAPSIKENTEHEWQILRLQGKIATEEKSQPQAIELVIVGQAVE